MKDIVVKSRNRILRVLAKAPIQILLVVIGLFWLVPTIGLFVISLMDPADLATVNIEAHLREVVGDADRDADDAERQLV